MRLRGGGRFKISLAPTNVFCLAYQRIQTGYQRKGQSAGLLARYVHWSEQTNRPTRYNIYDLSCMLCLPSSYSRSELHSLQRSGCVDRCRRFTLCCWLFTQVKIKCPVVWQSPLLFCCCLMRRKPSHLRRKAHTTWMSEVLGGERWRWGCRRRNIIVGKVYLV